MSRVAPEVTAALQTAVLEAAEDSRFVDRFWAREYPSKKIDFVQNNPAIATRARTLSEQGLSLRAIADELGITRAAAFRCCRTQAKETAS